MIKGKKMHIVKRKESHIVEVKMPLVYITHIVESSNMVERKKPHTGRFVTRHLWVYQEST
jgi:hypothetical protein